MSESSSGRFLEGYGGYELELASGEVIRCQALTMGQAAHFMRLLQKADGSQMLQELSERCAAKGRQPTEEEISAALTKGAGEAARAQIEIMETFPEAVGAKEQFEEAHITPAEFFDAVRTFMALRRPPRRETTSSRATEETEKETTTETPPGSTI